MSGVTKTGLCRARTGALMELGKTTTEVFLFSFLIICHGSASKTAGLGISFSCWGYQVFLTQSIPKPYYGDCFFTGW